VFGAVDNLSFFTVSVDGLVFVTVPITNHLSLNCRVPYVSLKCDRFYDAGLYPGDLDRLLRHIKSFLWG